MATKTVQLTIPTPCQQRWQDMKAEEQGRFCANCQKTVVDFSTLTDQQVIKLLARKSDSTCGRFRVNQLNRELTVSAPTSQPSIRLFSLLTAGLLGYQTARADALSSTAEPITQNVTQSPITDSIAPINAERPSTDSVRVITGQVIDHTTNATLPGATVSIKGTLKEINTDDEGRFQLSIPAEYTNDLIILKIAGIGFLSQELQLRPEQTAPLMITLKEDSVALNQVFVVGNYKKLTFFQRLRNRLRGGH